MNNLIEQSNSTRKSELWRFSKLYKYGIAVMGSVLVKSIKLIAAPVIGEEITFLLFFATVMLASWIGGFGPGILAIVLVSLSSAYIFMTPIYSLLIGIDDLLRLAMFILVALFISSLNAARKRTEEERIRALKWPKILVV